MGIVETQGNQLVLAGQAIHYEGFTTLHSMLSPDNDGSLQSERTVI